MPFQHAGFQLDEPLIVGVINISPESFYHGSIVVDPEVLKDQALRLISEGAKVIDIGALSSRPVSIYGGKTITTDIELQRIKTMLPIVSDMVGKIPISIDTQSVLVAKTAVSNGATVINDISGLKLDPNMATFIAEAGVDIVLMASNVKPGDVCGIEDTISALQVSLDIADDAGIDRKQIALDPGFGGWQGRDSSCDLQLIEHFDRLHELNLPIYVGVSRKSTIGTLNGGDIPDKRLGGSLALTLWLYDHGAQIFRTHDVGETYRALLVHRTIKQLTSS